MTKFGADPFNGAGLQYFTLPGLFHMESMEWGGGFQKFTNGFHGMGDGVHTFLKWIPWNRGRTPYFFKMDSMEWWMDSILFSNGFHGMGDGLHTFLRWIPWNGGWSPYFFHMDSIKVH